MGLTRAQLQAFLEGSSPIAEPLILDAYRHEAELEWRDGDHSPHGDPWHYSFHASSFPGDELACGRLAVYGLMDPPNPEPTPPFLKAMFDQGLDLEHHWVSRLRAYGALLSKDVTGDDKYQTGFEDAEHWLTGGCDAIVLPRGWRKGHLVEVKTTSHEKVLAMRANSPSFPYSHAKYLRQLKCYVGLARELPYTPTVHICRESGALIVMRTRDDGLDQIAVGTANDEIFCPDHRGLCDFEEVTLLPPDDGTLIYSSREEPFTVASFRVQYDPEFMVAGRAQLARWRESFLEGRIPAHPYEGQRKKWTAALCNYCSMKKPCKQDYEGNVQRLDESAIIEFARSIRPDYNYLQKRAAVLARWGQRLDASLELASDRLEI